jgi:hypothetical protein
MSMARGRRGKWSAAAHGVAAVAALTLLCSFWCATAYSELFGDQATVARVKRTIAYAVLGLVPLMAALGLSGRMLSGKTAVGLAAKKLQRMKVIAANGVGVLAPSAFVLAWLAERGSYGGWFYAIQAVELLTGALNVGLLLLNARDGLVLSGRLRKPRPQAGIERVRT